ncbi:MAG: WapI family immunity protein [Verrucomicrobiales bacterium]
MTFSFGQSKHERIEIDVLRYERAPVGEYHDDNWLTVQVRVSVGGFRGTVDGAFLTEEFVAFLGQLRPLYESLSGAAEFATLEGQLHLRLTGDRKGHIELVGEVADQPGIGNRLHFTLHFDQSQLGASIHELERVTSEFPIRAA